jgi:hypothetical protein
MKQTTLIDGECQHRTAKWLCARPATWGMYRFQPGKDSDVNLNMPVRIFCGQHKQAVPLHYSREPDLRYVKLNAKL